METVGDKSKSILHPWSQPIDKVVETLGIDIGEGLTNDSVKRLRDKFGRNQLRKHKTKNVFSILLDQLKSLIIGLLLVAALLAFWFGEYVDGWAIVAVIIINTLIGFITELRAVRSMEALFKLGTMKTRVRRGGVIKEIDAEELVPGDIVIVEGGDIITADMRIIESSRLQADESALTGESLPIAKNTEPVDRETPLAERSSMLYKGTSVTRGAGEGVVVSTGLETELGTISSLVEEAQDEQTPLEERLDKLGYHLIIITLLIAAFVTASGVMAGKELLLMVETGIALAVAAIPEGLPIVATIALAKGVRLMADKNALINRLSSVETLGATGIICTDKTGTLTENKMTVTNMFLPQKKVKVTSETESAFIIDSSIKAEEDTDLMLALEIGALCNNAALFSDSGTGTGDPLEVALLEVAHKANIDVDKLNEKYPEEREEAFDAEVKMMATWNRLDENSLQVNVKGAPGAVLDVCDFVMVKGKPQPLDSSQIKEWKQINSELASQGLRILALAVKTVKMPEGNPYEGLTFVGLVAFSDPPRSDIKSAIEKCRSAGIRVVMITGDQAETARYIANSVGLGNDHLEVIHGRDLPDQQTLQSQPEKLSELQRASIFARISPSQKLDLINFYQNQGDIVAMTGDGVNDAPALKKADIGIAMGKRGTQVAREAADMVLTDDAFSTIVTAIEEGRVIFGNIRRFIYYLMSCNVSEVLVVGVASMLGTPLPILPLQILFLNLVTDVFPALALGVGEGEEGIMQKPPREPEQPILGKPQWRGIAYYGTLITISVIGSLYIAMHYLNLSGSEAVTISFLTLAFSQLWHVLNMRDKDSSILNNTVTRNKYVWGALLLCVGLLMIAIYVPVVSFALQVTPPDINGWITVLIMSIIPLLVGQIVIVASQKLRN